MLSKGLVKLVSKFHQRVTRNSTKGIHRALSEREFKVSVLGACGSVGKPLSLLLKHSELISELFLYDVMGAAGMACDLNHIETKANVTGNTGAGSLRESLKGSDIVMIAAGSAWRSRWTSGELLEINAPIVKELASACATVCPHALIAVITSPVDSLVPIVSQVFERNGVYDSRRIFGVSTLNVVRANTFIARYRQLNPLAIDCPVIGGNFGTSVVPLVSKCKPNFHVDEISDEQVREITRQIQEASKEVEEAKAGKGATLSMAYAGARFANSLLRGLSCDLDIVECAFVRSDIVDSKYFSSEVRLNEDGVEKIKKLPEMTDYEKELLQNAVPQIIQSIELGEKCMRNMI